VTNALLFHTAAAARLLPQKNYSYIELLLFAHRARETLSISLPASRGDPLPLPRRAPPLRRIKVLLGTRTTAAQLRSFRRTTEEIGGLSAHLSNTSLFSPPSRRSLQTSSRLDLHN